MEKFTDDMYGWAFGTVELRPTADLADLEHTFWQTIKNVDDAQILNSVFNLTEETIAAVKEAEIKDLVTNYSVSFQPLMQETSRELVIKEQIKKSGNDELMELPSLYWQTLASMLARNDLDYCTIAFGLEKSFLRSLSNMSFIQVSRYANSNVSWTLRFNQRRFSEMKTRTKTYKFISFFDSLSRDE